MIRKVFVIVLSLILAVSIIACSSGIKQVGKQTGVVIPKHGDKEIVLTIMLNPAEYQNLKANQLFMDYVSKFEDDFGVKVKYETLGSSPGQLVELKDVDEYMKAISTKLSVKNGPELIFSQYMPLESIIKQGAAVKLNDRIPNLNKIYKGLLDDEIYFVPISIIYYPRIINQKALESTGMKVPELDWTSQDRFELRTKWLNSNKVYFNMYEWHATFGSIIDLDKLYDSHNNRIALNTPEIKEDIGKIRRYIFDGNYILNKNYKFENYYNMLFEDGSPEWKESLDLYMKSRELGHIEGGHGENLLRAIDVYENYRAFGTILMPEFSDKEVMLEANGFVVNKNANNLELAYEFINGLLSDEIQMKLYNNEDKDGYYPVNKEIEEEIKALEAEKVKEKWVLETKEYILYQIKNKHMKLWNSANPDFDFLKRMIEEDLARIILADEEYSEEELSAKLKESENKYNIFLNE